MRKYYVDNIRNLGILLLFPFHTCMIYNGFESFYIHSNVVKGCNDFILITGIWFMPLLFFLAGMSSYYALQKRTKRQYLKERFYKLLIPLFWGILLIIPVQTYYAEKFHNNYHGGYLNQYILFFTKSTDLTGYSGGFTPGHLWFLLYLFIITLLALPIMLKLKDLKNSTMLWFNHPIKLLLLFVFPFISSIILEVGGKSLGEFFAFVLLGFLISKEDKILDTIEQNRNFYVVLSTLLSVIFYKLYYSFGFISGLSINGIAFSAFRHLIMWTSILTIIGFGKNHLNFANKITNYSSSAAFPVYIFHQTWLVVIAYYTVKTTNTFIIQFFSIMILSLLASILTYEGFKRISILRFMFGIKKS